MWAKNQSVVCLRTAWRSLWRSPFSSQIPKVDNKTPIMTETFTAPDSLKVGDKIHGFTIRTVRPIEEFRLTAIQMVHDHTQAQYLHLARDDSNNVFSINFRTTPSTSTGLPHILEHLVLCGSRLYPVRDPFFKMLNRSLATFMNAMTGSDYTMYPFSTLNQTDYRNLQRIYLDAVFRPQLNRLDFMQEGWRLENTVADDCESPLIIKGVVYNEMKGVFSENENILAQNIQNRILPDGTYGVISGGDPMKIPDLTWDDLKQFHARHYNASNARFFSYGNFPLKTTLQLLNDEYLYHYTNEPPTLTQVNKQKRWISPQKAEITGRYDKFREDPIQKQCTWTTSIVVADLTDAYENFLLHFITDLLVKGPNAAFYKTMIEPNFSGGFTPTTGYDDQPRDTIFTLGLQCVKVEDFPKIQQLFDTTLEGVVNNGFDSDHIESVLHRYEIQMKHESANFGLHLLFAVAPVWNHISSSTKETINVVDTLEINSLIRKVRSEIASDPQYLQKTVRKYFVDNQHRLVLTMVPDQEFEKKQEKNEKVVLKRKAKSLSDQQRFDNWQDNQELIHAQLNQEDLSVLPTLTMADIADDVERHPLQHQQIDGTPLQYNTVNSNGVVYFKSILSTIQLAPEQQMLLPLFCYIMTRMGTDQLDYRQFDSLMNRKTGGLTLTPHIGESLFYLHTYEPGICISSYCLLDNMEDMWNLWTQLFNLSGLKDVGRFEMLVQLYLANLTHGLADSGHDYVMQAASGLVSGSSYQKDLLGGLQHIAYMKRLVKTSNYGAMLDEIMNIARMVFHRQNIRCSLNGDEANYQRIVDSFKGDFLQEIPQPTDVPKNDTIYVDGKVWTPTEGIQCQHHVINIPVNFCSKAILTVPYTSRVHAILRVIARLLTFNYLHPELREKRGAYGSGARLNTDGVFTFFSYRDPGTTATLDVFDQSVNWLLDHINALTDQQILEAKLGVFQTVDKPIPPSSKGLNEFYLRLTADMLQRHRAELMNIDRDTIKVVAQQYLEGQSTGLVGKVVLGQKNEAFETNQRQDELWTVMDNE